MLTITINGDSFGSLTEFYFHIEPLLATGNCPWGGNLDSLQDIVQNRFNYTEDVSKDVSGIRWINSGRSAITLGAEPTVKWLQQKMGAETSVDVETHFQNTIIDVINGKAPTLYDTLTEILSGNPDIELLLI